LSFYELIESILIPCRLYCWDGIFILLTVQHFKKVLKLLWGAPFLKVVNYTYVTYLIVVLGFQFTGDHTFCFQWPLKRRCHSQILIDLKKIITISWTFLTYSQCICLFFNIKTAVPIGYKISQSLRFFEFANDGLKLISFVHIVVVGGFKCVEVLILLRIQLLLIKRLITFTLLICILDIAWYYFLINIQFLI